MTKQSALIDGAIDKLSPTQKTVLTLNRDAQIRETAQKLGMTQGTVKIHLHRAAKKLKNVIPYVEFTQNPTQL